MHRSRLLTKGELGPPETLRPELELTPLERFEMKYEVTAAGCWEWRARRGPTGYGVFSVGKRELRAHRWAYEHYVGPIPDGLTIDHLCRNRACVNPDHLEAVTHAENMRRAAPYRKQNKTHCPQGHAYTPDNIIPNRRTVECRECNRIRAREYARRKRAAGTN